MSYIPDYRKETEKLNDVDKAYIGGYRAAIEDMKSFFDNIDDDKALSVEKEVAERLNDDLREWMEVEEIEAVCSLFDNADYLPDDIELVDAN